ncbi:hypothetical protein DFP72DRAFT_1153477 [Ephemerocybe angulata]|uniref:Uncharacterized protein n=1 Tax=Ephemerocybe angulata TaxID=980116 RepID=A0A8H6HF03_9AGAR|nr:hypothetical protein DFP72DRAFT_1153477 [Tulosesus angulatus]
MQRGTRSSKRKEPSSANAQDSSTPAPTAQRPSKLQNGKSKNTKLKVPPGEGQRGPPKKKSKTDLKEPGDAEPDAAPITEPTPQELAAYKIIAQAEDRVRRQQKEDLENAERPDLKTFSTYEPAADPLQADDSSMVVDIVSVDDGGDVGGTAHGSDASEDSDDPAARNSGQGESDDESEDEYSPGLPGNGPEDDEDSSDHSSLPDIVEGYLTDEEELNEYRRLKEKVAKAAKKAKRAKGAVREEVNKLRAVKPVAPYTSAPTMEVDETKVDGKTEKVAKRKPKKPLKGFRKPINAPRSTTVAHPKAEREPAPTQGLHAKGRAVIARILAKPDPTPNFIGDDEADDDKKGGFQDEGPAAVAAARSSKAVVLSQKNGTASMGVKISKVEISESIKKVAIPKAKKKNYSMKDLPLDGLGDGEQRWRSGVMPIIYEWAGTERETFAINSNPSFEDVVGGAWDTVFGDEVEICDDVYGVVRVSLLFFDLISSYADEDLAVLGHSIRWIAP